MKVDTAGEVFIGVRPTARALPVAGRFEWRLLRAERVLGWAALVLLAAATYAVWAGARWSAAQRESAAAAVAEQQARLSAAVQRIDSLAAAGVPVAPFGDPRAPYALGATHARQYAVLPQSPLAALAVGQSDLYPNVHRVSVSSRDTFLANDELEHPRHLLAGRVDLAFVTVYLLPLFVLALSFNMLTVEREQGTLAMLRSQPVRLRTILLAKVIVRLVVVLGALVAMALLAMTAIPQPITFETAGKLALWSGVAIAYALLWLAIAMLVNVRGRTSAGNALVLLGCWLLLLVVIPSLVHLIASVRHPAPSRLELVQAMRDASDEVSGRGAQLLSVYYQDHPELMTGDAMPAGNFGARAMLVQAEVAHAVAPVAREYEAQLARQQNMVDRFRFASPAVLVNDALTAVAGTDGERYIAFRAQAEAHAATLRAYWFPLVMAGATANSAMVYGIPEFRFSDGGAERASREALMTMVLLTALAAFLASLAWWRISGRRDWAD